MLITGIQVVYDGIKMSYQGLQATYVSYPSFTLFCDGRIFTGLLLTGIHLFIKTIV